MKRKPMYDDTGDNETPLFYYYSIQDVKQAVEEYLEVLNNYDPEVDLEKKLYDELYRIFGDVFENEQTYNKMKETCKWKLDDNENGASVYYTSCDNAHIFSEGTLGDNNYNFCPFCGKKIEELR
jgi:hypothetical protein